MTLLSALEVFSVFFMNDRMRVPGISCVQFISATTAANQTTVLQGSSIRAAISSQLSLTEEKMIPTTTNFGFFFFFSFYKKQVVSQGKEEWKIDMKTFTRNFSKQSKMESGKLFVGNCSGKILYFSLMLCFIICRGF